MKNFVIAAATMVLLLMGTQANAALLTLESRDNVGSIDDTDFAGAWSGYTNAITTTSLTEFTGQQPGNNKFNRLVLDFAMNVSSNWTFEAGLDAGVGAAIYLDGVQAANRTDDLWWAQNWNHGDVIDATIFVGSGNHQFELYWAEGCCNGPSSARFNFEVLGSGFQAMSVGNIAALESIAPEPTTCLVWSLLAGLSIGLGWRRRR